MKLLSLLPIILLLIVLVTCIGCMGNDMSEGFQNVKELESAPLDGSFKMSKYDGVQLEGVESDHKLLDDPSYLPAAGVVDDSYPRKEGDSGKNFLFHKNKCDPKCCGESPYSCSGGCVCLTRKQKDLILSRGGNRINVGNNF
jgi:hypothetical protein